jgi:hypothetical protein
MNSAGGPAQENEIEHELDNAVYKRQALFKGLTLTSEKPSINYSDVHNQETAEAYIAQNSLVLAEAYLEEATLTEPHARDVSFFFQQVCECITVFKRTNEDIKKIKEDGSTGQSIDQAELEKRVTMITLDRNASRKLLFKALQRMVTVETWRQQRHWHTKYGRSVLLDSQ